VNPAQVNLTTSALGIRVISYTLTINNVRDQATPPNPIAPGFQSYNHVSLSENGYHKLPGGTISTQYAGCTDNEALQISLTARPPRNG